MGGVRTHDRRFRKPLNFPLYQLLTKVYSGKIALPLLQGVRGPQGHCDTPPPARVGRYETTSRAAPAARGQGPSCLDRSQASCKSPGTTPVPRLAQGGGSLFGVAEQSRYGRVAPAQMDGVWFAQERHTWRENSLGAASTLPHCCGHDRGGLPPRERAQAVCFFWGGLSAFLERARRRCARVRPPTGLTSGHVAASVLARRRRGRLLGRGVEMGALVGVRERLDEFKEQPRAIRGTLGGQLRELTRAQDAIAGVRGEPGRARDEFAALEQEVCESSRRASDSVRLEHTAIVRRVDDLRENFAAVSNVFESARAAGVPLVPPRGRVGSRKGGLRHA